jgi:hypothetical protein
MPLFFLHTITRDQNNQPKEHPLVPIHEPPHNTNEGSEFLDDAIRMEDLPLVYTEESVAAGSPKNLL